MHSIRHLSPFATRNHLPLPHLQCLLAGLLLATALPIGRSAHADGCFVPEEVWLEAPSIPSQAAIICWRDGVETLVVESALDAEGQQFGWIIPVPASPTALEATTPGLLRTLEMNLQPEIVHDRPRRVSSLLVVTLLVLLAMLYRLANLHRPRIDVLGEIFLVAFIVFLYCALTISTLSASRHGSPGLRLERAQQVGNYDVRVLQADSGSALNQWLTRQGLAALPDQGKAIADAYAGEGWRFVSARLRRTTEGPLLPHPLSITFRCSEPIYPMRLTSLSATPVALDLFVVGPRRARVEGLEALHADQFRKVTTPRSLGPWSSAADAVVLSGDTFGGTIGHPGGAKHLWDKCFITRLQGTASPETMGEDFRIEWSDSKPCQKRIHSVQGARQDAMVAGLLILLLGAPALYLLVRHGTTLRWPLLKGGTALAVLALTVAVATYASRDTVEVQTKTFAQMYGSSMFRSKAPPFLVELLEKSELTARELTAPGKLRDLFGRLKQDVARSNDTDYDLPRWGDGPRSAQLLLNGDKLRLTVYDETGSAHHCDFELEQPQP